MSLNVYLIETRPIDVYENGITHNLGKMAGMVTVDYYDDGDELTLYDVLWRPDENELFYAHDLIELLERGLTELRADPEYYKKFNPLNNWGSYEGLIKFVEDYLKACGNNPMAEIRVSR